MICAKASASEEAKLSTEPFPECTAEPPSSSFVSCSKVAYLTVGRLASAPSCLIWKRTNRQVVQQRTAASSHRP